MCGIVGSFSKTKLKELIELNSYRGNHSYSLSEYDVKLILHAVAEREKLRCQASQMSNKALAAVFGVHERTIDKAIAGHTWSHVVGDTI